MISTFLSNPFHFQNGEKWIPTIFIVFSYARVSIYLNKNTHTFKAVSYTQCVQFDLAKLNSINQLVKNNDGLKITLKYS